MKTKKELKEAYKQMEFPMGVFQIENSVNNKVLIDCSMDMQSKWNRHKMELRFGNHRNRMLQNDWTTYGEKHFVFKVLDELKKEEKATHNYNKELKILQAMVVERFDIKNLY